MSFGHGTVVITATCKAHMNAIGVTPMPYLMRHLNRDWGNLGVSDKKANDDALKFGGRILSKYLLPDRTPIYVITESDRSSTCVLLCEDY